MSEMKDFKPYVVKALYDWIVDNGMTPQVILHTCISGVHIPENLMGELGDVHHKVLLNIGPSATAGLAFDIKAAEIRFFARFTGSTHAVKLPIRAIESIYAKETGEGNVFRIDLEAAQQLPQATHAGTKSHLRVVK